MLSSENMNGRRSAPQSVGASAIAIELRGIVKRFPGVVAVDDVSLDVRRGEVHALLGENGAGKSTIIKIVTGSYQPDDGAIYLAQEKVHLTGPHHAQERGISVVPQEVLVIPRLSIGRNILLGHEGWRAQRGRLSRGEREFVDEALRRVNADFSSLVRAGTLSVPQLRLAQFARALSQDGDVLVLDEPTAALNEHDGEILLQRVERAREEGKAVLYVTHRLSEVMRLADRVTVLRDGELVGALKKGEFTREQLVDLLTKTHAPRTSVSLKETVVAEGHGLSVRDAGDGERLSGISFDVAPGRIVGVAGVQGSGHGRLMKLIAGFVQGHGTVEVDGRPCRPGRPADAFNRGLILVPADRRNEAIVGQMSVLGNISISRRIRRRARRFGLRWPGRERTMTREYFDRLSIRAAGVNAKVETLSGGNQQKVALSRALESDARVLLVEEPTQGIDIDAKAEVWHLLREFANRGRGVVVATSEFEELMGLADEVVVMCMGRVVAKLEADQIEYRNILSHALP